MWSDLDRPPLSAERLRMALVAPHGPWNRLDVVARTGSTNADLIAAAALDVPDRSVLVTDHQDAGRGRHSRTWTSPPRAGLAVSVLLRPAGVSPDRLGWLPLVTGVAVADALTRVGGVEAVLKWPNDVLVHGRKVAGILAEVVSTGARPVVVVGIGVNVSTRAEELVVPEATSLLLAGAANTDRDPLLRAILRELATREAGWRAGQDAAPEYRLRCDTLGRTVRVRLPEGEVTATAQDVDGSGRLVLQRPDGTTRAVSAGDVSHVRTRVP